jgi:amidase
MRVLLLLSVFFPGFLLASGHQPPAAQDAPRAAVGDLSGRWVVKADLWGTPVYFRMELKDEAGKLTGTFGRNKLEGTVTGNSIHFLDKDDQGGTEECSATVQNRGDSTSALEISGKFISTDSDDPSHPETHTFTATLAPRRSAGSPQRYEFTPTTFYRQFSPANVPVLRISPGDTVPTTTADAGGTDEKGVTRVLGGNPETAPFFIETAEPGDTLVVHLTRLRLNRDWAGSDDSLVSRGMDAGLAQKMKDVGKGVRWHLDTAAGVATLEKPGEQLAHYSVPLRPMLGCIATAPPPAAAPPGTGDSGRWGGNMDFNEIIEGGHGLSAGEYTGCVPLPWRWPCRSGRRRIERERP